VFHDELLRFAESVFTHERNERLAALVAIRVLNGERVASIEAKTIPELQSDERALFDRLHADAKRMLTSRPLRDSAPIRA
jgi:hypothetical protein